MHRHARHAESPAALPPRPPRPLGGRGETSRAPALALSAASLATLLWWAAPATADPATVARMTLEELAGSGALSAADPAGPGSGNDVPTFTEAANLALEERLAVRESRAATSGTPTLGTARPLDETRDDEKRTLAAHGPWLTPETPSRNARQLLAWIADAGAHGLNPARYDLPGLRAGVAATFAAAPPPIARLRDTAARAAARAALSYRFGRAFTRLATDLGRGVVDARSVQSKLYRDVPDPPVDALRTALANGETDVDTALGSLLPTHEGYLRLVETMRKLLAERDAGVERLSVDTTGSLRVGHHHDDVMRLKRRLVETGELPIDTVITPLFDDELVVAVEAFQRRHGIEPAGVVDLRTREALNRRLGDELDALALSLERWRWMPRELGERHVFVNLPDYRLQLVNGAQHVVDMPVVIGATEHETPSFSREMSYMEFNPTWTVPSSIANDELVPLERRRPGYLRARNFDFLKVVEGRLVPVAHESVTREDFHKRPFPYVLRQRGGKNNALGRMKFMMPNPYAIYLHDTQAQRHFTLHDRAYSHGCIRLGDPDRLASLLLQIDGKSLAEAERAIRGSRTRRVRLERPVPTHLAYFTTWVDAHGDVQRREDVYAKDPALREALQAHGMLPSLWPARSVITANAGG